MEGTAGQVSGASQKPQRDFTKHLDCQGARRRPRAGRRGHCPQSHSSPRRRNRLSKPMRQCVLSGFWPPKKNTTKERGEDRDYWHGSPNDKHICMYSYAESLPSLWPTWFVSCAPKGIARCHPRDKVCPPPSSQSLGHCPTCLINHLLHVVFLSMQRVGWAFPESMDHT